MGFKDKLKKFVTGESSEEAEEKKKEDATKEETEEETEEEEESSEETCALCGEMGTDKKWAGQRWHKACIRRMRKQSRKMI